MVVFELMKEVKKQGKAMENRDKIMIKMLEDIKEIKGQIGRKITGGIERNVKKMTELMLFQFNPFNKCLSEF